MRPANRESVQPYDRPRLLQGARWSLRRRAIQPRPHCLIHAEDDGFSPETYSHIKRLARDASKTGGGRDGTEYDDGNGNARSYLTHHMQRISSDIVMATADQLITAMNITKRSANGAAY